MSEADSDLEAARRHALDLAGTLAPMGARISEEKRLARAMLEVRRRIRGKNGQPDWLGRTGTYRAFANEVYSAVDGDGVVVTRLKYRLRQHFKEMIPKLMDEKDIGAIVDENEANPLPTNGDFFDALGPFIRERGCESATSVEASQMALAAGELIRLINPLAVANDGSQAAAIVSANLQHVADLIAGIQGQLHGK